MHMLRRPSQVLFCGSKMHACMQTVVGLLVAGYCKMLDDQELLQLTSRIDPLLDGSMHARTDLQFSYHYGIQ